MWDFNKFKVDDLLLYRFNWFTLTFMSISELM